jgi:virginiamycin B lyase
MSPTLEVKMLLNRIARRGALLALCLITPVLAFGGDFKSFRIPTADSQPRHITLGLDGNMWFTESNFDVSQIGRVDSRGNITEFVVPTRFSQPFDIVSGFDGALWFTEPSGFPFGIGRLTTSGEFTEFGPDLNNCDPCSITPNGIAAGPDGNFWFTDFNRNAIGKFDPSSGTFTFYAIPTPNAVPSGITVGPDGALWFAEFQGNQIGRIDTFGNITEFGPVIGPDRITTGPDGNLWVTEPFNNKIGRITPVGVVTEFPLPNPAQPRDIVTGPDGNLWFTEFLAGQLARITPDGVVTEVQKVRGGPWGIGRGVGNTIWITQINENRVARYTVSP